MSIADGLFDLLANENQNIFGDVFQYTPANGDPFEISGIFESSSVVIDNSGEVPVETRRPVASIRKSDFDSLGAIQPVRGDLLDIKGKTYRIAEIQDDGQAEVTLILMRNTDA